MARAAGADITDAVRRWEAGTCKSSEYQILFRDEHIPLNTYYSSIVCADKIIVWYH